MAAEKLTIVTALSVRFTETQLRTVQNLAHLNAMARQGKCNPSQFRVIPIVEVKHERVN